VTAFRGVLLLCALLALSDGAAWEAVGLVAFVVVLCVAWPGGAAQRPVGVTVWLPGGRWRR
jgi:hypothetical protein